MFVSQKKTIDGTEFEVAPFSAIEALKLQSTLLRIFGPAFGAAIGAIDKKDKNSQTNIDGNALGSALQMLFDGLDETQMIILIERLLKKTSCTFSVNGGAPVVFDFAESFNERLDIVFQGRLMTVYKVIGFVLEVNYPDFFGKIGAAIGKRFRIQLLNEDAKNDTDNSKKSDVSES